MRVRAVLGLGRGLKTEKTSSQSAGLRFLSSKLPVDFALETLVQYFSISCQHIMAMYIRVKRNKTTYFVQCDPTETALDIKVKLSTLVDRPIVNQRLTLLSSNDILEDEKTLADQKVENDAIIALTFRKDDGEFEEVNIARPPDRSS